MDYATPDKLIPWCSCIMGVLVLLAIHAGVQHYKFWKYKLCGRSLSSMYQKVRLVLWSFGVAIVGLYSIVVLWLFGFWIQLFMELFKG